MLGRVGYDVAMFLGRHKAFPGGLGPKMIKSASVFAVDAVKHVNNPATRVQERSLIKWPAIIWEICGIHADHVARACTYEAKYVEFHNFTDHKMDMWGNPILPNEPPSARLAEGTIWKGNSEDFKFTPRVYLPISEITVKKATPGNAVVADDQRQQ